MTDETKVQEPIVEEGAPQPQAEGAPAEAAEPEVPEVKKEPPDTDKALREARRDAKKLGRKLKRTQKELDQARQYRQRVPVAPPPGVDEQEIQRQKAAAFDQMQQEEFIKDKLSKLKLEQDDPRLDRYSPETFLASAAAAKMEDLEDWEAELADKEKAVEGLGDKLRADAKAKIEETIRDIRRESGLDAVAKPTPAGEGAPSEEKIREKYKPQFDALRSGGGGRAGEFMVLKREMEAEIEEARSK